MSERTNRILEILTDEKTAEVAVSMVLQDFPIQTI